MHSPHCCFSARTIRVQNRKSKSCSTLVVSWNVQWCRLPLGSRGNASLKKWHPQQLDQLSPSVVAVSAQPVSKVSCPKKLVVSRPQVHDVHDSCWEILSRNPTPNNQFLEDRAVMKLSMVDKSPSTIHNHKLHFLMAHATA